MIIQLLLLSCILIQIWKKKNGLIYFKSRAYVSHAFSLLSPGIPSVRDSAVRVLSFSIRWYNLSDSQWIQPTINQSLRKETFHATIGFTPRPLRPYCSKTLFSFLFVLCRFMSHSFSVCFRWGTPTVKVFGHEGLWSRAPILEKESLCGYPVWISSWTPREARHRVVVKIIAQKNMRNSVVYNVVKGAWAKFGSVKMTEVDSITMNFEFGLERDKNQIMDQSPWLVQGHCLNLKECHSNRCVEEIDFGMM